MKTTIHAAGRLVIPNDLRRRAGIQPGMVLDVRWRSGRIEVEPAVAPIDLECRGRFLVAITRTESEKLTAKRVEETLEAIREEQAGHRT